MTSARFFGRSFFFLFFTFSLAAKKNSNFCHKCVSFDSSIPRSVNEGIQDAVLSDGIWLPWVYHLRQCADPFDDNSVVPTVKCRSSCYKLILYLHYNEDEDEKEIVARGCKDQLMEPHKLSTDLPKDNGCAEISFSEELQVKLEENLNMLVSGSVCFCKGKNCNGAQMASQESFLSGNTSDLKSLTQKIPSHDITATPTSLDLSTQMTNQVIATSVLNQYVTTAHEDMIEGSTGVAALSDDLSVVNELNEPIDESRNQIETMSNNSAGVTVPDYDFQHLFKEFESEVGSGESLSLSERLEINSMDNQTDKFSTVAGLLQKNITRVKQTLVEKRDEKITKIPQIHFNEPFNQANRLYFSFLLAVLMIAIKF